MGVCLPKGFYDWTAKDIKGKPTVCFPAQAVFKVTLCSTQTEGGGVLLENSPTNSTYLLKSLSNQANLQYKWVPADTRWTLLSESRH